MPNLSCLKPDGMDSILHIILQDKNQPFALQSLLCENVKCLTMLFPEVYRLKRLITQLNFRRLNSPEKVSVKNDAPIFVPFMIYDFKSLFKPLILKDISQETDFDASMNFTANIAQEPKSCGKTHTTRLNFLFYPFASHCS